MGTGKKKIEIEKITKKSYRMVTFSKRRKGLFKKNEELESLTGSQVSSVVLSPAGRIYTYGDVNTAINMHFSKIYCMRQSDSDVVVSSGSSELRSSSTSRRKSLRDWVEDIDVEQCQNLNQLLLLKEQLEGTKKKIVSIEDSKSFQALFM
ncbi:MADS-box transcription factor 15-like [Solanum pennellii]|uniref:MADS-box transcription factor 15-like n=1 Tax=Solanum pennellii TaxID=28526 RepID=A0ABM1GBM0_SOLPN|nr:MADS-box transcription factor 15-like [Solanum pennellii]